MTTCISFINMKGGVGKTTVACQLAWYATMALDKKVLLIDLDPQANASQSIMTPRKYVEYLENDQLTVANIFEEFTPTGKATSAPKPLKPAQLIFHRVNYTDGSLLHLVPSRLELSFTLRNPAGKETLLARFLSKVAKNYDLIMIDCAPTDSMLTDAAYQCSRWVVVPIRAEFLASIGFPLLQRSLESYRIRHDDHTIEILGLVLNDYDRNDKRENRLARQDLEKQAIAFGWHIFSNGIPHSDSYYRSAREGLPIDQTKGAWQQTKDEFAALAEELFGRLGLS